MRANLDKLLDYIRLADMLDIAIVALLVYAVFVWLRKRASRSLGLVAGSLALLFFLAHWLDLYLTILVFQYGLVGMLLTMVIVFQDDIRNGLERLATLRWFAPNTTVDPSRELLEAINEAVINMAHKRIGALLVFPGHESLERHIRAGVQVDARISVPLLLSIFHPQSPGHDGAVLIENNRITSLGVHLPLTKQVDKVPDCGTRHAAALGLTECCDGFVVVVSEEGGTVTIAYKGELTIVDTADLPKRLHDYFESRNGLPASKREHLPFTLNFRDL